jgi:lipid II:glycine glycyltransferase (peptidoglycan interpeptide bridge formation enzyme)
MNYSLIRQERITKLQNKIQRVTYALKNYRYTKAKDYLEDLAALEAFQKELQIQEAYLLLEGANIWTCPESGKYTVSWGNISSEVKM